MNPSRLQVSDKVVLHRWEVPPPQAKPRIVRGRLYCVEQVVEQDGRQFVGLAGVEFRGLTADRRKRDPQSPVSLYAAEAFTRVAHAHGSPHR